MEKTKLTTKNKICLIIAVIVIIGFCVGFGFIIYYYLWGTSPTVRKKMASYCSNDDNYFVVYGRIIDSKPYKFNDPLVSFSVELIDGENEDFISNTKGLYMPLSAYNAMMQNGVDMNDDQTVYKFITSAGEWYGNIHPYTVAVLSEDGQTAYLDYQVGKQILLDFIKNDLT